MSIKEDSDIANSQQKDDDLETKSDVLNPEEILCDENENPEKKSDILNPEDSQKIENTEASDVQNNELYKISKHSLDAFNAKTKLVYDDILDNAISMATQ